MNNIAVNQLDLARLLACIRDSHNLVRQNYRQIDGSAGGWYHELAGRQPGATATALGLMIFDECDEVFAHFKAALTFLRSRQIDSTDQVIDGGWATNTSAGHPVVEATGWVARMIGSTRSGLAPGAPDAARALRWLTLNQNDDGGWGSFRGCPSRVWLTCLALRGLAKLNPRAPAIERGVQWLIANRSPGVAAWGGTTAASPTVVHTAFSLLAISEVAPGRHPDQVSDGYRWLVEHVDPAGLDNQLETYIAAGTGEGSGLGSRLALWHCGLPVALSALLRHPAGPPADLVPEAARTIIQNQKAPGYWSNAQGGDNISLWSVWWCTQALSDVLRVSPARFGGAIVWLPGTVVVQSPATKDTPLTGLLPARHSIDVRPLVARHWAGILLTVSTVIALGAVALNMLDWSEVAFGMLFPIFLFVLQEYRGRRSSGH